MDFIWITPEYGILFRAECSELKALLDGKTKALDLVTSENLELKKQLEEMTLKAKNAEAENKMLVDRWMLQKMQDAERLNEVVYHLMLTLRWAALNLNHGLLTPPKKKHT